MPVHSKIIQIGDVITFRNSCGKKCNATVTEIKGDMIFVTHLVNDGICNRVRIQDILKIRRSKRKQKDLWEA